MKWLQNDEVKRKYLTLFFKYEVCLVYDYEKNFNSTVI